MDKLVEGLKLDLSQGLEVLDAAQLSQRPPAGDLPLIIRNLTPDRLAMIKRTLGDRYPADHPVEICRNGASERLSMHELDRLDSDYGTSIYVPPLKRSEAGDADPRGWTPVRWPADPLIEVMSLLRSAQGCPWDREQTHRSLRKYLLEEAYEVVEAIDTGDPRLICEELGDVLLQVAFHAQVAREAGSFDFHDVVEGITAKLVRRHPHVFGDVVAETASAVTRNWEAIKRAEKGDKVPESLMDGLSMALPALSRAHEAQKRAAKVGFDWGDVAGPAAKVREELEEVLAASQADQEEEVGDLLFATVNLARALKVDPETALAGAIAKFTRRFRYVERRARETSQRLEEMSLADMDALWNEAKQAENRQKYG